MLSPKDYVYSFTNGIGQIREVKNNKYMVHYQDTDEEESIYSVNEISTEVVEQLKSKGFRFYFSPEMYKRGMNYYKEDRVESVAVMKKTISGRVTGTDDYDVSITFSANSIRTRCSCPVGTGCKHAAAVLIHVSEVFIDLDHQTNSSKESKNTVALPEETVQLVKSLDDWNRRNDPFLSEIISWRDYLEDKDSSFYEALIAYLNQNYRSKVYSMNALKRVILYNEKFYSAFLSTSTATRQSMFGSELIRQHDSNWSICKNGNKMYFMKRYSAEIALAYYVTNYLYEDMLEYLFDYGKKTDIERAIPILLRRLSIKDSVLKWYFLYLEENEEIESITRELTRGMSTSDKEQFYLDHPNLSYTEDFLRNLPIPKQLVILENSKISKDIGSYILNRYYTFRTIDEDSAIKVLFRTGYYNYYLRNDVISLLKETKDTQILMYLLKPSSVRIKDVSKDEYYKYCIPYFEVIEKDEDFSISYGFHACGIKIYETMEMYSRLGKNTQEYLPVDRELIRRVEATIEYQQEIARIKEIIEKREFEKKKKAFVSALSDFEENIRKSDISLSERNRMSIEASVTKAYMYMEGYALSLRTGNDKLYVVKDVVEFLDAVKTCETLRYGKGLEFQHKRENFDDAAQKLLDYLLSLPYRSFVRDSRKGIVLSDSVFGGLLQAMEGDTIEYKGKPMSVSLLNIKPSLSIDENYILHSSLENVELLELNKVYVFDHQEHRIDCLEGSQRELQLYLFAYQNDGMNLSYVKQEFMDTIYSRFKDYIELPPSLEKEFLPSVLEIEAYFDYDSSNITLRTSYKKDEELIRLEDITSPIDQGRIRLFEGYIEELGFVENRITDEALIFAFFMMDFTHLRELCTVYLSESIMSKTVERLEAPMVRIQYNNSIMEILLEESEYTEEELFAILSALRKKKKYALLNENRIVDLSQNGDTLMDMVEDLNLDGKHLLTPQESPVYQSFKAQAYQNKTTVDGFVKDMMEEIKHFKDASIEIPSVHANLREYQKEGFKWMSLLSKYNLGGILADDMGLGKTLEMITLFHSDSTPMPSLIVCPKSLVFNWISEFHKFNPETQVVKIMGSQAERRARIQSIPRDEKIVYITGYDSIRMDIDAYQGKMFNYLVLDEAQAIKNVNAVKSKSVKSLVAQHRFALTGTPIENSVIDLWSIFDFLMPGFFPELMTFKRKYESNPEYTKRIAMKCAPFILRRTKEEVLTDLPGKYERILSAEMSSSQKKIYDAFILEAKNKMEAGLGAFDLLPYLTRLRQICVDPQLFVDDYSEESGKIGVLKDILTEYIPNGHRILLFSSFVSALTIVKEYLEKEEIQYLMLTGETKPEKRLEYVNLYNQNEEYKVFLISLKAGGTGLNLTGADTVIHLDPWWNVSAENQATDRAYRIGQKRNVEVIKLICENSVEEKVIDLQNMKKDIIDKVIAKNDSSITGLSLEDVKFILE